MQFRRDLRARIADVARDVLDSRQVTPGFDADSLALVVIALAHGLALEALPDPDAVPEGLVTRVLGALVGPERQLPEGGRDPVAPTGR